MYDMIQYDKICYVMVCYVMCYVPNGLIAVW